jgi:hypothetical protein
MSGAARTTTTTAGRTVTAIRRSIDRAYRTADAGFLAASTTSDDVIASCSIAMAAKIV